MVLLGGLSCVSFGALGILLYQSGSSALAFWCFSFIAAILPYIMLNLGVCGKNLKSLWACGKYANRLYYYLAINFLYSVDPHPINAVTALWIIAIPLADMVAIMYRRLRKGMSPFHQTVNISTI